MKISNAVRKLKFIFFILSFGIAFNINLMGMGIDKEKVREKRKNFIETSEELSKLKRVKLDENYFQKLPIKLKIVIAKMVLQPISSLSKIKEVANNISSLAQANRELSSIIRDIKFQIYLLNLIKSKFHMLTDMSIIILIGTPYMANWLKIMAEESKDFKEYLDSLLIDFSVEGNIDVVKFLLNSGADPNSKNKFGESALSLAVEKNYYKIAQLLCEQNIQQKIKDYTLLVAAKNNSNQIIELLLNNGADPEKALNLAQINRYYKISQIIKERIALEALNLLSSS